MTNKNKIEVEICCGDIESLYEAAKGGAKRVELCHALSEGGVTPPLSMISAAKELGIESVNVLIRPRMGDFVYSDMEVAAMVEDIRFAKSAGATGIVSGALLPDGSVDIDNTKKLIEAAEGLEFVFHRAFDRASHPLKVLETLIKLGCNRILTSGCSANAIDGISLLKELVTIANGRIAIMAGAGVTPKNVAELVHEAGVTAVHSTAKRTVQSRMTYINEKVFMGADDADEYSRPVTSSEIVKELIANANK